MLNKTEAKVMEKIRLKSCEQLRNHYVKDVDAATSKATWTAQSAFNSCADVLARLINAVNTTVIVKAIDELRLHMTVNHLEQQ